jgi:membrane-associated phospholipid phosphatase
VTGLLVCAVGFAVIVVLAYWVGPTERLDRSVLDALNTRPDTFINEVSYVGFQIVNFRPAWVLAGALAVLIALAQWRIRDAVFAAALIAGAGGLVLIFKALLANPRYQPVPVDSDAYPWKEAFPSGHSAGSLAWSLAFLSVVPISWRRPTAIVGVVFTLYISFGVLVLNYHYPSDVLGGWLLAAGWWFALLALWEGGRRTGIASTSLTHGPRNSRKGEFPSPSARCGNRARGSRLARWLSPLSR